MKTSELSDAALDWAVGKCIGLSHALHGRVPYSTDWAHGGPIIERAKIELIPKGSYWDAFFAPDDHIPYEGETLLIAAMRAFVASKLGDEVEVPEEMA